MAIAHTLGIAKTHQAKHMLMAPDWGNMELGMGRRATAGLLLTDHASMYSSKLSGGSQKLHLYDWQTHD